MSPTDWTTTATRATSKFLENASAYTSDLMRPTIRLGVTGLARSGKTVFITSLIHNLIHHGRLPFFAPFAEGRIKRVYLEPQPDDNIPRFEYERHLAALTSSPPSWPESTKRVSQLRLTIEFEPTGFIKRTFGTNRLSIDIVDYPGEWILDLPLLNISFDEWSRQSIELAQASERSDYSREWLTALEHLNEQSGDDETTARNIAGLFTAYLKRCRTDEVSFSTVPPGRFLMPGDMEGSPALTFSPLLKNHPHNPLHQMMERRFEAYKSHVIKPFFHQHFAKLDRQIVLVDALQALNAGPQAVQDLQRALTGILKCFRPGKNSWLASILGQRIDRILFAATKADHLHHTSHDNLENILGLLTKEAVERAQFSGAKIKVRAIAALRATRETEAKQNGETLPCILGHPLPGEHLGERSFDGTQEIAIFPGDLPHDPEVALAKGRPKPPKGEEGMRFIRFRPPECKSATALPHIRLDRALQFLLGDKLS